MSNLRCFAIKDDEYLQGVWLVLEKYAHYKGMDNWAYFFNHKKSMRLRKFYNRVVQHFQWAVKCRTGKETFSIEILKHRGYYVFYREKK